MGCGEFQPQEDNGELTLQLSRATRDQLLSRLDANEAPSFRNLDLTLLRCGIDAELAERAFSFCGALPAGAVLRLAHNDLGSGTDCEQRLFELKDEREQREAEKAFHRKKKSDSSKEKDFAASAQMRRTAEAGIQEATSRLEAIDEELARLDICKAETPWHLLFSQLEGQCRNAVRFLDLSNCGLHATGLAMLVNTVLELEHRAEGEKVSWLALDGNDLGDIGMGTVSSLLRLTGFVEVLQLRNVGITDQGVSLVLSGLVANKSLALLDVRANGLCSPEVGKAALAGMRRFNGKVEVLLG